jgi:hypothetical protein
MDGAEGIMTEYLLCVLIAAVAYLTDVVTSLEHREREGVAYVVLGALLLGGVLYGFLKLIGWLVTKYGGGLI